MEEKTQEIINDSEAMVNGPLSLLLTMSEVEFMQQRGDIATELLLWSEYLERAKFELKVSAKLDEIRASRHG